MVNNAFSFFVQESYKIRVYFLKEDRKQSIYSRAFLVCLFGGGGAGWGLITENKIVKQINSYPIVFDSF